MARRVAPLGGIKNSAVRDHAIGRPIAAADGQMRLTCVAEGAAESIGGAPADRALHPCEQPTALNEARCVLSPAALAAMPGFGDGTVVHAGLRSLPEEQQRELRERWTTGSAADTRAQAPAPVDASQSKSGFRRNRRRRSDRAQANNTMAMIYVRDVAHYRVGHRGTVSARPRGSYVGEDLGNRLRTCR
jgi:hypothetical protein